MLGDVISSLGGSELAIAGSHIGLGVARPQKCLAGPPGMALVAASALGRGLADLGVSVDVGAGADAVMAVLSEGPR